MITFHAYAEIFPLIEGDEFEAFVEDIRANGIRDAIVLLDGAVLEGRNRYRALESLRNRGTPRGPGWGAYEGEPITDDDLAIDAGLPWFERFSSMLSGDPLAFVISKNLKRRHLNDDQRRIVAAKLVTAARGRPSENPAECGIKVAEAAKLVNVDEAGTERARTVLTSAAPEIIAAAEQGRLSVSAAAQAAKFEPEKQRSIAEQALAGISKPVHTFIKKETRTLREQELARRQADLPDKKYGVIYADPEWRFEPYSRDSGMDRAADNHYPTSPIDEICQRPIETIAADDCVLFLWATVPMLPQALDVMRAWGFDYKSHCIWRKDRIGTGYWFRNAHEILLVGTRGKIPAPAMGEQWCSVVGADVGKHSEKPAIFYELIERYFPNLPKIELNARRARPGWDAWGLEAPECDEPFDASTGEILPPQAQPAVIAQPIDAEAPHLNSNDPLEIPQFLRRVPVASASIENASAAGPPHDC